MVEVGPALATGERALPARNEYSTSPLLAESTSSATICGPARMTEPTGVSSSTCAVKVAELNLGALSFKSNTLTRTGIITFLPAGELRLSVQETCR